MDRVKLERANGIAEYIDYYDKMITDLESADCVEFFIREEGSQRQLLALQENWSNNSDLFDVVIGSILTEIRERKRQLEEELEKL